MSWHPPGCGSEREGRIVKKHCSIDHEPKPTTEPLQPVQWVATQALGSGSPERRGQHADPHTPSQLNSVVVLHPQSQCAFLCSCKSPKLTFRPPPPLPRVGPQSERGHTHTRTHTHTHTHSHTHTPSLMLQTPRLNRGSAPAAPVDGKTNRESSALNPKC